MKYRVIVSFEGAFDIEMEAESEEEAIAKADKEISEDYEGKFNKHFLESASVFEIYVSQ